MPMKRKPIAISVLKIDLSFGVDGVSTLTFAKDKLISAGR